MSRQRALLIKSLLLAVYICLLIIPGLVFFGARGGLGLLGSLGNFESGLKLLFPLFGLYAFSFVALQAAIGPNVEWLGRYFVDIKNFHRFEGTFALLFIILHPLSIVVGYGFTAYWQRHFVSPDLVWWLLPAYTALLIVLTTIGTAILNWWGLRISWWRKLHRLNYLVFVLAGAHSWFIGSDVRATNLKYLWLFYLAVVIISFAKKYWARFSTSQAAES